MPRRVGVIPDPVVHHHLYGGPVSGRVLGFSGAPLVIRTPIPGTGHVPPGGRSTLLDMATYLWDGHRYVHEDMFLARGSVA